MDLNSNIFYIKTFVSRISKQLDVAFQTDIELYIFLEQLDSIRIDYDPSL